ncbi:EutN/CcmL family microcompartment protein [Clostridium gasigenes]|uniref:Ethanolamine utilization protein EutN n=1 Tax=Clostridium gasigenes TaxID=94869 RepID=A0A1H0VBC1_9CLOT|nr:EutN/CcmL family microcompartment protein [Clostridium gasigenes]MBB6624362.1 EutN/CcmL family microcompartment protein [Clostridium gasigenes]MBU3088743.1 EutN/CcmL family microcompartment protein [Clostridium gasigenes]MBU3105632.1 EutN/CcmL family microcompartment protein [Clostridium gasigenes]MBU3109168.1 EutN/CcmL family microcompartment protein [Clostridium gasigenes]MBU3132282.1 EutN/CcmL family microcompartment protein [Clostridium gasigenes]
MVIGKVVGNIWSTRKDEKLNGIKFMVVKPLDENFNEKGEVFVAADNVGAGIGDTVLVTTGSAARISIEYKEIPVDAVIVGIVDSVEVDNV